MSDRLGSHLCRNIGLGRHSTTVGENLSKRCLIVIEGLSVNRTKKFRVVGFLITDILVKPRGKRYLITTTLDLDGKFMLKVQPNLNAW